MLKLVFKDAPIILDTTSDIAERLIRWMSEYHKYEQNYFSEMNTFVFNNSKDYSDTLQYLINILTEK